MAGKDLTLSVEILGAYSSLTKATQGAQGALQGLNKSAAKIGSAISGTLASIGVGFGLYAVVDTIKDSIKAASDMEQQFGAVDSIFKGLAPEMQDFAKTTSKLGLSTADAARSSALLGTLLKGSGMPMRQVADQTKKLTLLAADLAATFGGTTADAVAALSSTFKGEFDPIEKFGVSIKKLDINNRVAEMGMKNLTGAALKQAEAQAALQLIYEKTTDAQGQAIRESDTFAGKTAELQAKFTDLQATIATDLLPIFVDLSQWFIDVLPGIQNFWAELTDPTTEMGAKWAGMWEMIGLVGQQFQGLLKVFSGGKGGFSMVMDWITTLAAGVGQLAFYFGKLAEQQKAFWSGDFGKSMDIAANYTRDYNNFVAQQNRAIDKMSFAGMGTVNNISINLTGTNITAQDIVSRLNKQLSTNGSTGLAY